MSLDIAPELKKGKLGSKKVNFADQYSSASATFSPQMMKSHGNLGDKSVESTTRAAPFLSSVEKTSENKLNLSDIKMLETEL